MYIALSQTFVMESPGAVANCDVSSLGGDNKSYSAWLIYFQQLGNYKSHRNQFLIRAVKCENLDLPQVVVY